jgi:hypothetical protein
MIYQIKVTYPGNVHSVPDFTYRLGRLKPRASKYKGHLAKVYNIFEIEKLITQDIVRHHICFDVVAYVL